MNDMDTKFSTCVCVLYQFIIHFLLFSALKELVKYDYNLIYHSVNYKVSCLCLNGSTMKRAWLHMLNHNHCLCVLGPNSSGLNFQESWQLNMVLELEGLSLSLHSPTAIVSLLLLPSIYLLLLLLYLFIYHLMGPKPGYGAHQTQVLVL